MKPGEWNEAEWLQRFRSAVARRDWDAVRGLRAEVFQATAPRGQSPTTDPVWRM
jgi:hypothetical protein